MDFKLTILGTASALPTISRYPSAQVLELRGHSFLIDCGECAQIQMRRNGISIQKIDSIFISHMHGDHLFGIFGLLSTMSLLGRTAELTVYAPAQFATVLSFFKGNFAEGLRFNIVHRSLAGIDKPTLIKEGKSYEVYSFPLNHRVACFGFLFREKEPQLNIIKEKIEQRHLTLYEIARLKNGEDVVREDGTVIENRECTYIPYFPRAYAYCSDTAAFDALADWVKGVDLLYHETTFDESNAALAEATFHSTAAQAARCALRAGAGKLLMGHYSSRYPDLDVLLKEARDIFPDSVLTKEGMVFDLPLKK